MSDIAFHFGAPDKVAYACRLLRKATAAGAKVRVLASPADCEEIDVGLWGVGPTDFVTHCLNASSPSMRAQSRVILGESMSDTAADASVLVNLDQAFPIGFERFERVIEVVSTDEEDRALARERWKQYTRLGYTITRHDLALRK